MTVTICILQTETGATTNENVTKYYTYIYVELAYLWNGPMLMPIVVRTRMWANAQPDGRPAEYRWRPLFNAAKFGWRPLLDAVQ